MVFELEERRVDVADLALGMFVCRLDRPWEQTPFPLQGVTLTSRTELDLVRSLCDFVYVDVRRQAIEQALTGCELFRSRFAQTMSYEEFPVEQELTRARDALSNASTLIECIFRDVGRGQTLSADQVEQAVRPIVASVLRSADAFFWVEGLRSRDSYSYGHAIHCSALAAAFGRHLGFSEETIISLTAGGLLMDVGRTQLPDAMLDFPGPLTPEQTEVVHTHVDHGLDILASSQICNGDVIDIMRTHHERFDGSGYPNGLVGRSIPIAGRMLAIIDAYDAMSSVRPYRAAMSRVNALREIYISRDSLFQAELVEQFQVCLGVYPTGSLVELSSGEVAVVTAQNRIRRLRPRVAVLTDPNKQPLENFRTLDLLDQQHGLDATVIVRSLVAGDYGIDATEYFLQ